MKKYYVQSFLLALVCLFGNPFNGALAGDINCTAHTMNVVYGMLSNYTMPQSPLAPMPPAVVVSDPNDTSVCENDTAWFRITATSATGYQWQRFNGGWSNLTNAGVFEGTDTNLLVINMAGVALSGNMFRCIAFGTPTNDTSLAGILTVNAAASNSVSKAICTGDSAFLGGAWQLSSGTFYDTLTSFLTCDSVIETTLTVASSIISPFSVTVCNGDSAMIYGQYESVPGAYDDTLAAAFGCDSIVRTTLIVLNPITSSASSTLCSGDSLFVGGAWQLGAGVFIDTLISAIFSCDSVVSTTLTVSTNTTGTATAVRCPGDSVFLAGAWQTALGPYIDTLVAAGGCDSILTTTLTAGTNPTLTVTPANTVGCEGVPVHLSGPAGGTNQWIRNGSPVPFATTSSYTAYYGGHYNLIKTNSQGCADSAATGAIVTMNYCANIEEYSGGSEMLNIFPNPSAGNFTVSFGSNVTGPVTIEVMNVTGKVVLSSKTIVRLANTTVSMSLAGQPDGIYLVAARSENGISTQRFVKAR